MEMTTDFLKFKVFVNSRIHHWTDRHSGEYPDLFLWKKIQSQYFQGSAAAQAQSGQNQSDQFTDKYQSLRTYKVIFERNKREVDELRVEFMRMRFECVSLEVISLFVTQSEAKKLMGAAMIDTEFDAKEEEKVPVEEEEVIIQDENPESETKEDFNFLDGLYGQESTQIDAPIKQKHAELCKEDNGLSIDIAQHYKEANQFQASAKNISLYRVLNDNRKSIERRLIPLLEMFKVETGFFKQLQTTCLDTVLDKKQQDQNYQGRIKIAKKDVTEFEEKYAKVEDEDIMDLLS